jgi:hypothetical protein
VPTGFTAWDPGTNTTIDNSESDRVLATQASHAGNAYGGLFRDKPATATAYRVCVFQRYRGRITTAGNMGVMIAEDLGTSPTTGNFVFAGVSTDTTNGPRITAAHFAAYNAGGAAWSEVMPGGVGMLAVYVGIHVNETTGNIIPVYSVNGREWGQLTTRAGLGGMANVTKIGLCVNNGGTLINLTGCWEMFRVDYTSDPFEPIGASK